MKLQYSTVHHRTRMPHVPHQSGSRASSKYISQLLSPMHGSRIIQRVLTFDWLAGKPCCAGMVVSACRHACSAQQAHQTTNSARLLVPKSKSVPQLPCQTVEGPGL
jgi:hypothetical protein